MDFGYKFKVNKKSKKETEEQLEKTRKQEMEEELTTLRSTLGEKDKEIQSLQQSKGALDEQLNLARSSLEQRENELQCANKSKAELEEQLNLRGSSLHQRDYEQQCANKSKGQLEEQLNLTRSALDQGVYELQCANKSKGQLEEQLNLMRSALQQRDYELQCANKSKGQLEEQLNVTRATLHQREYDLQCANKRFKEMDDNYMHQFQAMSSAMNQRIKETESHKQSNHMDKETQNRVKQVESQWQNKLRAVQEQRHKEAEDYHYRIAQMDKHYNEKLQEKRCALNQKEEELKSFKDRVANDVALSIQTGKTESMNNPVGKTRLKEMYEDLRLQWPQIKNSLKTGKETPTSVKAKIHNIFEETSEEMEQKKKQIDEVFGLNEGVEPTPQKLEEYKLSTAHYLQLNLYYLRKGGARSKPCFENPQEVMEYVVSQCSWLGRLMALNNPPLQPDWDNHDPGMNAWDIFPRHLRASSSTVL